MLDESSSFGQRFAVESKVCAGCGESFETQTGVDYCSPSCWPPRGSHQERPVAVPERPVQTSEEPLKPKVAALKHYKLTCCVCGCSFESRRYNKAVCSNKCAETRRQSRRQTVSAYKGLICSYCGDEAESIDHIVPVAEGGGNDPLNLVPACQSCNSSKGTKSLLEFLLERRAA